MVRRMTPAPHVSIVFFLCVASTFGCVTALETFRGTAVERDAFDLDCPSESMHATKLGETTRIGVTPKTTPGVERTIMGVTGCNKKAVYVIECSMGACNAQLNADVKDSQP